MNMHALVLHVLGDALGNIGVIATGLVIWLSSWSFKYYFDPVISLVITVIIFSSALPLVRSASFILLQGVPSQISLDEVRSSILDVEGVLSLHELHVWQLSETKNIASVHVMVSKKHDFMSVAAKIREALHHHGIHSSTVQPEYPGIHGPEEQLMTSEDTSCLIVCPQDNECSPQENACCPPASTEV
jgi:zinc transporter 1